MNLRTTKNMVIVVGLVVMLSACASSNNPTSSSSGAPTNTSAPTPTPITYSAVSPVYFNITNNTSTTATVPAPVTIADISASTIPSGYSTLQQGFSISPGNSASATLYIPYTANYQFGVGYEQYIVATGTYDDYEDVWNSISLVPGNTYTVTVGNNAASIGSSSCDQCFLKVRPLRVENN